MNMNKETKKYVKKVYNPSKESQVKVKMKRKKALWDFLGIRSL